METKITKTKRAGNVRMICEGGIAVALSIALSYIELQLGTQGGSVDIVMVPLIVFALRNGAGCGVISGLIFGVLKYIFANGIAISWVSIIFDYSVAYAAVGVSGLAASLFRPLQKDASSPRTTYVTYVRALVGTLMGCLLRYFVHFMSGVTVYAEYMPDEFLGLKMNSAALYSLIYNGLYMIPNTIAALIIVPIVVEGLKRTRL